MNNINFSEVRAVLTEGRRASLNGQQFFILRGNTAPGQGKITYQLQFFLRDGEPPYEVLEASIPESMPHNDAMDCLIEKAIAHLSI